MHLAALHLIPILGAEKSKTPFYIAGGVLVAWALIVSLGLGLRNDDFPGSEGGQRAVIGITVLLVLATAATAIITAGGSESKTATSNAATPAPATTTATTEASVAETSAAATSTTAKAVPPAAPKATTGTPAPPSSPAAPSAPLSLAANPGGQLSYNTKQLSVKAGKVTINFANASPVEHNVVIAQGSKVLGQTPIKTGSSTLSVNLKPGTYTFYCAVPGHRQAGMEGTLTVS